MTPVNNRSAIINRQIYDVAPWGAAPGMKSRISGLGKMEPPLDPACVFDSAPMRFAAGPVTISVELEGFSGPVSFMLLDLTNAANVKGSPRTRLQLIPVELHPDRAEAQLYQLRFMAYDHIIYQLAGYIHGDAKLSATGLIISSDRPFAIVQDAPSQNSESISQAGRPARTGLDRTARLYDLNQPDLEWVHSQPLTAGQLFEPAFLHWQAELFGDELGSAEARWPDIYIMRAAEMFGVLDRKLQTIGFDAVESGVWPYLLARKHDVLIAERTFDPSSSFDLGAWRDVLATRHPCIAVAGKSFNHTLIGEALPADYCRKFDLAWWTAAEVEDWRAALRGALNVADSLGNNGLGIAVFPIHFNDGVQPGAVSAKTELPRILIDILSLGHQLVQVRMPNQTNKVCEPVSMGLIMHRATTDGNGSADFVA